LGTLGDPADKLIAAKNRKQQALRFTPRRLFISASRRRINIG
jgi:hypothetical protein